MAKVKEQTGAALIEFAIVLPVLVLLLFGIVEFSIALYDKAMITNASREGARLGIVFDDNDTTGTTHTDDATITAKVNQYCQEYLITWHDPHDPGIEIHRYDPTLTTEIAYGNETHGDALEVTVTYDYDFLVLPNFVIDFLGTSTLTAVTIMRFE